MILEGLPTDPTAEPPIVVVGAGPAGIVLALELERRGIEALVLAGGGDGFEREFQELADAQIVDPAHHAVMRDAVRRSLGGTSLLWGGRVVPFDEVDFAARPQAGSNGWPIAAAEVAPWYDVALRYLDAGPNDFSAPLAPAVDAGEVCFDRLERWSEGRNLRRAHAARLERDGGPRFVLGAVAVGIDVDPATGRVESLLVAERGGRVRRLRARAFVLACGGLETTRLLLAARMQQPRLFGGADSALGRYYMGHIEGRIAEIEFTSPIPDSEFGFFVDRAGRYARRRITLAAAAQQRHGLLNLAAWPDNPPLGDPRHGSAILSLACLALRTPVLADLLAVPAIRHKHLRDNAPLVDRHLGNIARGLPGAVREAAKFLHGRYLAKPRLPGFFLLNRARRYTFLYHAEQAPNPASSVSLTERRDALGLPRLRVDLRLSDIDAASVLRSHAIIDRELRRTGIGRLDYAYPEEERAAQVLAQSLDGYHQIGTTRMSESPQTGVVDGDCRVHGTPNLFVASSSTFPTSGQANPTLLIAALSARLAAHLARLQPELDAPSTLPARRTALAASDAPQ